MSNRCAIDKKPEVYNENKVFGRFDAEAELIYEDFDKYESGKATPDLIRVPKLYDNANALTYFFTHSIPGVDLFEILKKYPLVAEKVKMSPTVSIIESSGIVDGSINVTDDNFIPLIFISYDKSDRVDAIAPTYPTILEAYEAYLKKGGYTKNKMGRFCSLAPNIFEGIKDFYSFYDNISSLANGIMEKLSSIKNLSAAAMLKALEDNILGLIDDIVRDKLAFLRDFKFANVMKMETVTTVHNSIIKKGKKIKDDLEDLFSEKTIDSIKKKIQGLIAYAVGVFERRDIEEIEFLVYRFCNLASMFEQDAEHSLMRLKNFTDSYEYARNTISASSKAATARAVRAGAIRFDPPVYRQSYSSENNRIAAEASAKGIYVQSPITPNDIDGVTPWNDGNGDSRIYFDGGIRGYGRIGWDRVVDEARVGLMRVQARFGKRLRVNSGYRDPDYNRKVGGERGSKHISGTALDISWEGFGSSASERSRFVEIAKEEGFKGFGGYNRFIHIDLGPRRSWGSPKY